MNDGEFLGWRPLDFIMYLLLRNGFSFERERRQCDGMSRLWLGSDIAYHYRHCMANYCTSYRYRTGRALTLVLGLTTMYSTVILQYMYGSTLYILSIYYLYIINTCIRYSSVHQYSTP